MKTKKKFNILYKLLLIELFLILLFGILKINKPLFITISIFANTFLITIIKEVSTLLNIKFNKYQKITIICSILLLYVFYFISIYKRNFIYYWDYSCYYNIQLSTQQSFNRGLIEGIRYFVGSTWSGEYGNFISFFPQLIFNFTPKTINAYILSCVATFIPYIIVSLSILLEKISEIIGLKNKNKFLVFAIASLIFNPILHATFIYGQPDLFGLIFIFPIISLTCNYDFKNLEWQRLTLLLLGTFMLIICRRWYIYFIISYYLCYILYCLITNAKQKNDIKKIVKNGLIFLTCSILFLSITLFPLIKNIINSNIGSSYAFYLTGGFTTEIVSQVHHVGIILFIIMLIGIFYGIYTKKLRLPTILSIVNYFTIIILFTRIQNMGLHHSLLLLPNYLYNIALFILLIYESDFEFIRRWIIPFAVVLIFNFICSLNSNYSYHLFTDVHLKTPEQEDYKELGAVATYLKHNLNKENTAYMITHNNKYNPDKLRNFYMPDMTISKYLPYGSAIEGVHKFPLELFTSKYIITTIPFESVSVEKEYNQVFMQLVNDGKFKLIKDFDMNNGYNILIYKRTQSVDKTEAKSYEKSIEKYSQKYPELYKNIIENFISNNLE